METLQRIVHVALAGLYVFLTSVTVLAQLTAEESVVGLALTGLMGAWAGASATLRTRGSLILAAVGAATLALLSIFPGAMHDGLRFWVGAVMAPLAMLVWVVVVWRRATDETVTA
ncbi:MAG: hypothetical protein ACO1OB_31455 [Archangium sp.]